ncbi:MAG: hypothetical protein WCK49_06615 [Myxococcaceae bacterium]
MQRSLPAKWRMKNIRTVILVIAWYSSNLSKGPHASSHPSAVFIFTEGTVAGRLKVLRTGALEGIRTPDPRNRNPFGALSTLFHIHPNSLKLNMNSVFFVSIFIRQKPAESKR